MENHDSVQRVQPNEQFHASSKTNYTRVNTCNARVLNQNTDFRKEYILAAVSPTRISSVTLLKISCGY